MPVIRTKNKGEWARTTTRTPIDDTLTKKGYAADAAAVGAALKNGGTGGTSDAVQYIPQTLTEEQQMQARKNLGLYYRGQTLLDEAGLTLENGAGQVGLAGLADGDIRVVLTSDLGSTEFYGTAFYIGNPVYAWNFEVKTADRRNGLHYDGYTWEYLALSGQADTAMDGTYTVQVYSLDTVQVPAEYIPDTIARTSAIPTSTSQLKNDSGFITADDIPESSGASEMELIHTGSVGEDGALSYLINADMEGNPFSLSEFELEYTINRPEDNSPSVNMGAYSFNDYLKSSFSTNGSSGDSYLLTHGNNSSRDTTKPSYYRVVYRGKIVDGILYMKAFATGYAYDADSNQVVLTGNGGSFVVGQWNDIVSKGALFPDGLTSINIAYYYRTLMNANITLRGVKNV